MAEAIYNGVDNLDRMAELAPNYNRFLARLVEKHFAGEKQLVDFGAGTGTFLMTREAWNTSFDQSAAFGSADAIVPNVKKYAAQTMTNAIATAAAARAMGGTRRRAIDRHTAPIRKKSSDGAYPRS